MERSAGARFVSLEWEIAELHTEVRNAIARNSSYQKQIEDMKVERSLCEVDKTERIQRIDARNHL